MLPKTEEEEEFHKYAANRKYSGSQSRIPIFKGSTSPKRENNLEEETKPRSSSLSNYQGGIPRLKSNEKILTENNITNFKTKKEGILSEKGQTLDRAKILRKSTASIANNSLKIRNS